MGRPLFSSREAEPLVHCEGAGICTSALCPSPSCRNRLSITPQPESDPSSSSTPTSSGGTETVERALVDAEDPSGPSSILPPSRIEWDRRLTALTLQTERLRDHAATLRSRRLSTQMDAQNTSENSNTSIRDSDLASTSSAIDEAYHRLQTLRRALNLRRELNAADRLHRQRIQQQLVGPGHTAIMLTEPHDPSDQDSNPPSRPPRHDSTSPSPSPPSPSAFTRVTLAPDHESTDRWIPFPPNVQFVAGSTFATLLPRATLTLFPHSLSHRLPNPDDASTTLGRRVTERENARQNSDGPSDTHSNAAELYPLSSEFGPRPLRGSRTWRPSHAGESDPENRSYRVRRRLNADGDEETVTIPMSIIYPDDGSLRLHRLAPLRRASVPGSRSHTETTTARPHLRSPTGLGDNGDEALMDDEAPSNRTNVFESVPLLDPSMPGGDLPAFPDFSAFGEAASREWRRRYLPSDHPRRLILTPPPLPSASPSPPHLPSLRTPWSNESDTVTTDGRGREEKPSQAVSSVPPQSSEKNEIEDPDSSARPFFVNPLPQPVEDMVATSSRGRKRGREDWPWVSK